MTRKGWLLFIAVSVFWGIPYLFIKIAVRDLDPTVVVFARAAIGAAVLLPVAANRQALRPLRSHWPILLIFSLIHMVGSFLLISYGEQHISSSLTSLLIATSPLLVALLALGWAANERVNGLRLAGLLLGIGGLIVLLGFDIGGDGQQLLGAALVLLASLGYAVASLLLAHSSLAKLHRLTVASAECSITALVLLPVSVGRLPARMPGLDVIASLLVLGLICTALALLFYFALIAEVGASRGIVITYVNPAVSVLLGVLVLHEALSVAIVVGFLLIIGGSWLSTGGAIPFAFARNMAKPEATR